MSRYFAVHLPHELLDVSGDLAELLSGARLVGFADGALLALGLQHVHLLEGLLQHVQHPDGVIRCGETAQVRYLRSQGREVTEEKSRNYWNISDTQLRLQR